MQTVVRPVIKRERAIARGLEVVAPDTVAGVSLMIDWPERTPIVTEDPHGSRSGSVKREMIEVAGAIIIEGEGEVSWRLEVVAPDTGARVSLAIDWLERATAIPEDPDCPRSRSVERKMVLLFAVIVIECKGTIGRRLQIVTANTAAGIALTIDRRERAAGVFENPKCTGAWTIKRDVVEFAAVVVIEGEGLICFRFQIIATNSVARISLTIDGGERAVAIPENPECACARTIKCDVVELPTVVIVESECTIGRRFKIITANAGTRISLGIY